MSDPAKTRRHAERVKELVASLVREIKDPRLGMVTITDARITGDLREATVYYTVLGDPTEQAATQAALESAKGMLRTRVGHALGLRHAFVLDNVLDHAKEIDDLLAEARLRDDEVQRLAAGKQYAGDPDPYKAEDDEDDAEEHESSVRSRAVAGRSDGESSVRSSAVAGRSDGESSVRSKAVAGRLDGASGERVGAREDLG